PDHSRVWHQIVEQFQPFGCERVVQEGRSSDIAARSVEAGNETEFDRVAADREYDWNARRCGFGGKWCRRALDCHDHSHAVANQIGSQCRQSVETTLGPAIFDRYVAALDIAAFIEASPDGIEPAGFTVRAAEQPDHRHRRLLSPRALHLDRD